MIIRPFDFFMLFAQLFAAKRAQKPPPKKRFLGGGLVIKLFLYGEGVDFCHGFLENKQSVGNGDFSVAVNICRGNLAVGKADLSDRTPEVQAERR